MPEHFTRNTVSAVFFCGKCRRQTQHRIDDGRKGPCLDCIARLEGQHISYKAEQLACQCGREPKYFCGWKVSVNKSGTCDKAICAHHAKQVAPGKYLCPEHQRHYNDWKVKHPPPQRSLFEEAA